MILSADYHTHTTFSHGKGSVADNANAAKNIGLKQIGITDHGFAHPAFGLRKGKLPALKSECEKATACTGVKVLSGIESNIIGTDGTVDLKSKYYDYFDIFLAGLHKFVMFKPGTFFSVSLPDIVATYLKKEHVSKGLVARNTKMFVNVVKNNPVDVITHLNFFCFADVKEVGKVCADYGTYIELNSKKIHLTDFEIEELLKTDVKFVIDSDAHSVDRVGEISLVEKMLERTGFPLDRIMNIDGRLPEFRFAKFKAGVK
ncbi:MAG: PHP domain-containing protein [Clostridia bacterium]|nr:PHP domain-containing protein [Clostridia bacterium]